MDVSSRRVIRDIWRCRRYRLICRPLLVPLVKDHITPMATEHYNQNAGCLYSFKICWCGRNWCARITPEFMRTRKPRSVERAEKPPAFFAFSPSRGRLLAGRSLPRELLIRGHCSSALTQAPSGVRTTRTLALICPLQSRKPASEPGFCGSHAVWAAYSDPGMELLESLGFAPSQPMSSFAGCASKKTWCFPCRTGCIPSVSVPVAVRHRYATNRNCAYRLQNFPVFGRVLRRAYLSSTRLRGASLDNATSLAKAAGVNQVFPLKGAILGYWFSRGS